jgi:general secretion pathway protein I
VSRQRGFTLLEALVATLIMGIAVTGILSGLATASRNAARLTDYDRATVLARSKMDELLVDHTIQRKIRIEGAFDPAMNGGAPVGWRAMVTPFETEQGASPGKWVLDRIELEIWWMSAGTRHSYSLEGYRRSLLQAGDI